MALQEAALVMAANHSKAISSFFHSVWFWLSGSLTQIYPRLGLTEKIKMQKWWLIKPQTTFIFLLSRTPGQPGKKALTTAKPQNLNELTIGKGRQCPYVHGATCL